MAGAVGSSVAGGFSWAAMEMGAAFGGTLGGFGNSSVGRAFGKAIGNGINKGIGKLPFGQYIQRAGQAIGNGLSKLYQNASGDVASIRQSLSVKSGNVDSIELEPIRVIKKANGGESVYRVWGGEFGPDGEYWTPKNPATTPNYRGTAGLPAGNSGEFLSSGTLKSGAVYSPGNAAPIGSDQGGLTEYRIPNPQDNVDVDSVTMPDEPY